MQKYLGELLVLLQRLHMRTVACSPIRQLPWMLLMTKILYLCCSHS